MAPWTTRLYKLGDENAIKELFELVFETPLALDRWRWQYLEGPVDSVTVLLAISEEDQRLAGQYALCPLPMQIGGEDAAGALSLDTMVHPDFRGQQMFTKLAADLYDRVAEQGIRVVYGFPNEQSHKGFIKYLGWADLCPTLPILVRPLNFTNLLEKLMPVRLLAQIGGPVVQLGYGVLHGLRKKTSSAYRVEKITKFDERFDDLWQRARKLAPNMVRRDSRYLNWRYVAHPEYSYTIWTVLKGDRLAGYAVSTQQTVAGLDVGFVADILVDPHEMDALNNLLAAVIADARKNHCDMVSCLMFEHSPYTQALKRYGFILTPASLLPQEIHLGVRNNSDYPDSLLHPQANWYVTWGDHDRI